MGVEVPPGELAADHAGLFLVGAVVRGQRVVDIALGGVAPVHRQHHEGAEGADEPRPCRLDVVALMVDGVNFAEARSVVALAITANGTKVPIGLWLGDTENTIIVTALLAGLVDRGLSVAGGLLVAIDGAKALAAGVRKVFGDPALVQRCTLHYAEQHRRPSPQGSGSVGGPQAREAFANPDADAGLRSAKDLARSFERDHSDAAASLREGLEEMFTVWRLGVGDRLARALTNTNCIEVDDFDRSHNSAREAVASRDDGQALVRGWDAQRAAQLPARQGCQDMPVLVTALARHVDTVTPTCDDREAA